MLTDDDVHDMLEDFVKTHEAWLGHRDGPIIKCARCQKSPYDEAPIVELRFPAFWELPDETMQDGIFWLCWVCLKELFDELAVLLTVVQRRKSRQQSPKDIAHG